MNIESLDYFNGPYLKKNRVLHRHYQENIYNKCKNHNSLVVLPTGLGKTIIGILLIAESLRKYEPSGKVIIMAPTRPLVSQHEQSCKKFIDVNEEEICFLTGKVSPERRLLMFNKARIIISTPQVIKNDLMRGRYDLASVSLIIFDESHRTTGNYAYTFISNEYINTCNDPLILGLTASPGHDYQRIQQLCKNLFIENIVFRTLEDDDVKEYIHEIDTFMERICLPIKILELSEVWNALFKKFLKFFIERDLINPYKSYYSKLDFLRISRDLTLSLQHGRQEDNGEGEDEYLEQLFFQDPKIIDVVKQKGINIQSIFSYCSSCISVLHGKDLLETQDISLFQSFLDRLSLKAEQDILSAKRIINSKHYQFIHSRIEKEGRSQLVHPKIQKVISIINEEKQEFSNKKVIIFTQYREMAELLKNTLQDEFKESLIIEKFIGQASRSDDCGFSQGHQIEIIKEFKNDNIDVLIATSVAEEGLDIPSVDAIIFYEPVPSEIRLIQRRGRTGRAALGRCYILVTEDTIDVPYYIVAKRKENAMNAFLLNPDQLELNPELKRKKIKFQKDQKDYSDYEILQNFKERRSHEKELLAHRSIEDIISELDKFSRSKEFKKFKNYGISFFSDVIKLDENKIKNRILKIKGKKNKTMKERKIYLNGNVKTLINIVKTYCEDGKLSLKDFQELAEEEDIIDRKFYAHFNQACYLGYLKRQANCVHFIKDF